ncbi:MAG: type II toxin-antitoxin system VapC family toxin [Deltaproteobacteria bacterium]|nr:type II toxin-antitoxin system VapC family toxin [Deltaproteobacteria bacterium]
MDLSELPGGSQVGIDSNVFIYHFCGRSKQCTDFLRRIERGELRAVTTREVLWEVLHRLMVFEAIQLGIVRGPGPAAALARKAQAVCQLRRYYADTKRILSTGVRVLPALEDMLEASQPFRERYGLLTTDSIIAAGLVGAGVTLLATEDRDFERVAELRVAGVSDVE